MPYERHPFLTDRGRRESKFMEGANKSKQLSFEWEGGGGLVPRG